MNEDDINKELGGLIERNKDVFDEFTNKVSKVEIDINTKTFKEKNEYEEMIKNDQSLPMSREALEDIGFKPIFKYADIIIECINKMAKNENREDIMFKNEEIQDHNKWLKKIKELKGGDVWINLNESLMWCAAYSHEDRVKIMRDKVKTGCDTI